MKLPIPLLLYVTSVGLVGFTGWQVYELWPLQKKETKSEATNRGQQAATDRISVGKSKGATSTDWFYTGQVVADGQTGNRWWWMQIRNANFIGKLPPPPAESGDEPEPVVKVEKPVIPLEDIFELAALVYDSRDDGKGRLSHVVVRYKPDAGVVAPEWYVRQMQSSPINGAYRPGDGVPPPRAGGNPNFRSRNNKNRSSNKPPTPMPVATTPTLLLQKIWVQGADVRSDPHLWPPFEHIRLVRVDPSAESAYFVREAVDDEAPEDSKEEQLFKTSANLSQDVLRALAELAGREGAPEATGRPAADSRQHEWLDEPTTRMVGDNRWNIGREDETRFGGENDLLEKVYFDTYSSRYSSRRGLVVKNVDPQLATRFGVAQGDVLLSVNGRPVKTKAAAMQFGKKEYKKGVRTFVTRWLSGGQEVERVYQLPNE